jgi:hypothetical protein
VFATPTLQSRLRSWDASSRLRGWPAMELCFQQPKRTPPPGPRDTPREVVSWEQGSLEVKRGALECDSGHLLLPPLLRRNLSSLVDSSSSAAGQPQHRQQ